MESKVNLLSEALQKEDLVAVSSNLDFSLEVSQILNCPILSTQSEYTNYLQDPFKTQVIILCSPWTIEFYATLLLLYRKIKIIVWNYISLLDKFNPYIINFEIPSPKIESRFLNAIIPDLVNFEAYIQSINPEAVIVPRSWQGLLSLPTLIRGEDISRYSRIIDSDLDDNLNWLVPEVLMITQKSLGVRNPITEPLYYHYMSFNQFSNSDYYLDLVQANIDLLAWYLPFKDLNPSPSFVLWKDYLQDWKYFPLVPIPQVAAFLILSGGNPLLLLIGALLAFPIDLTNSDFATGNSYTQIWTNIAASLIKSKDLHQWSLDHHLNYNLILQVFDLWKSLPKGDHSTKISEVLSKMVQHDPSLLYQYSATRKVYLQGTKTWFPITLPQLSQNLILIINNHPLDFNLKT